MPPSKAGWTPGMPPGGQALYERLQRVHTWSQVLCVSCMRPGLLPRHLPLLSLLAGIITKLQPSPLSASAGAGRISHIPGAAAARGRGIFARPASSPAGAQWECGRGRHRHCHCCWGSAGRLRSRSSGWRLCGLPTRAHPSSSSSRCGWQPSCAIRAPPQLGQQRRRLTRRSRAAGANASSSSPAGGRRVPPMRA